MSQQLVDFAYQLIIIVYLCFIHTTGSHRSDSGGSFSCLMSYTKDNVIEVIVLCGAQVLASDNPLWGLLWNWVWVWVWVWLWNWVWNYFFLKVSVKNEYAVVIVKIITIIRICILKTNNNLVLYLECCCMRGGVG